MDQVIEWLETYDYLLLLVSAFLLVWLVWIPRIVAPLLSKQYANLHPAVKSILTLLLPTIEGAMMKSWDTAYNGILKDLYESTDTPIDDEVLAIINERIQELLGEEVIAQVVKGELDKRPRPESTPEDIPPPYRSVG
ncbi:MAG TPA: hypothetical protein ENI05_09390 [Porticoccus sp.]|nr:hypothetical protein [Porticoccus sp.]